MAVLLPAHTPIAVGLVLVGAMTPLALLTSTFGVEQLQRDLADLGERTGGVTTSSE